jgi:hypothetical protein
MTLAMLFYLCAFFCFGCGAVGVPSRVNYVALGLAFCVLVHLIG